MKFLKPDLAEILLLLEKLEDHKSPLWGKMCAQRMIEHLTDTLQLANGQIQAALEIKPEHIEKAQAFIGSTKPMPKLFEVSFAKEETKLRNQSMELAIDEFAENWVAFEHFFELNPDQKTLHPYFGELDYKQWKRLNSKHLTHHFEQFGLLK